MARSIESKLDEYLRSRAVETFDWETNNCVHFVAGWVKFLENREALVNVPPQESATAWLRWVSDQGGIEEVMAQHLGWGLVDTLSVQCGDIVLAKGDTTGWQLGICAGHHSAFMTEEGEVSFTSDTLLSCWKHV